MTNRPGSGDLNWHHDTFAYADTHDPETDHYPVLLTAAQVEVTQSLTAVQVRPDQAAASARGCLSGRPRFGRSSGFGCC